MQVADFNADGKADVVLFENNPGGFRVGLSVLLGNGDGTFAPETFYAGANDNSGSGYVVDVDGKNGKLIYRGYDIQSAPPPIGFGNFGLLHGEFGFGRRCGWRGANHHTRGRVCSPEMET